MSGRELDLAIRIAKETGEGVAKSLSKLPPAVRAQVARRKVPNALREAHLGFERSITYLKSYCGNESTEHRNRK